jgi:hypothetical protein
MCPAARAGAALRDANGRVDIVARPVVVDRQVGIDVLSITIGGTFDVGKACLTPYLGARLCAAINRQADKLKLKVAAQMKAKFNADEIQDKIAAGVRAYLDTKLNEPLLSVRSIVMANGQITIAPRFGR